MPELEIIMGGYSINTDQTRLGLCTVTLIRGEVLSIVDVAHFGRRNMLVDQLEANGISTDDIGRVILTHCHWDHSQNTDLFPNAEIVIHADELEYSRNPRRAIWPPPATSPTHCLTKTSAPSAVKRNWNPASA